MRVFYGGAGGAGGSGASGVDGRGKGGNGGKGGMGEGQYAVNDPYYGWTVTSGYKGSGQYQWSGANGLNGTAGRVVISWG